MMVNKYLTAGAEAAAALGGELCRSCLGSFVPSLTACLRPRRGRAAVIGFSMKDHQQLPGGLLDCSVALLYLPSAPRL
ncbi:hypothetical protein CesoFtcFv8_021105 [Champsocephalus esox]|nr:hypothetical protein CesoFtcFv8_021105 [Champsocephalus esox]